MFGSLVVGGACLVMLTIAATALTPVPIEAMPGQLAEHGGVLESAVAQARLDCAAAT